METESALSNRIEALVLTPKILPQHFAVDLLVKFR
jgi:hypothetical protein